MMRRGFLASCGAAAMAALGTRWPAVDAAPGALLAVAGPRVQLVLAGGAPVAASRLVRHGSYVFLYPFESTPCFLLDLGRAVPGMQVALRGTEGAYAWAGGVGPRRSIVAYSAICPHAYTHPTREVAMIHYDGPDTPATVAQRTGVVTCCAHGSTFDPTRGSVPLQPPAEIPLAGIVLEWDADTDGLFARGVVGRPVFEEFFRSFPKSARREVQGSTPVWELERYSRAVLSC